MGSVTGSHLNASLRTCWLRDWLGRLPLRSCDASLNAFAAEAQRESLELAILACHFLADCLGNVRTCQAVANMSKPDPGSMHARSMFLFNAFRAGVSCGCDRMRIAPQWTVSRTCHIEDVTDKHLTHTPGYQATPAPTPPSSNLPFWLLSCCIGVEPVFSHHHTLNR